MSAISWHSEYFEHSPPKYPDISVIFFGTKQDTSGGRLKPCSSSVSFVKVCFLCSLLIHETDGLVCSSAKHLLQLCSLLSKKQKWQVMFCNLSVCRQWMAFGENLYADKNCFSDLIFTLQPFWDTLTLFRLRPPCLPEQGVCVRFICPKWRAMPGRRETNVLGRSSSQGNTTFTKQRRTLPVSLALVKSFPDEDPRAGGVTVCMSYGQN